MGNRKQIIRLLSTDINNLMRSALHGKVTSIDLAMQAKLSLSDAQINQALNFVFAIFKSSDLQRIGFYSRHSPYISVENKTRAFLLYSILAHYHQGYYQTLDNMIGHYQESISGSFLDLLQCIDDMIEYNKQAHLIKNQVNPMQPWSDDESDLDEIIPGHSISYANRDFIVANQDSLQCEANLHTLKQYVINHLDPKNNTLALRLQALKIANVIEEELRNCVTNPQVQKVRKVIDCVHITLGFQTKKNVKACIRLANELCRQVNHPRLKILGGLLKRLGGAILYGITFGHAGSVTMQRGLRLFEAGKNGLKTSPLVQELQQLRRVIKK